MEAIERCLQGIPGCVIGKAHTSTNATRLCEVCYEG